MKQIWNCIVRIKTEEGFRSHLIEKPSFSIGRTQEADLPILINEVSRLHLLIKLEDSKVIIIDQKSANGTYVNGRPIESGHEVELQPQDVVRLGNTANEFRFMAVPRPFELLDVDIQKNSLLKAMDHVARDLQAKAREQLDKEIKRAQLEAEQTIAQAKRDAEIVRTQGELEIHERKQKMEAEFGRMRQEVQAEIAQEHMKARREADLLISESQKRIQRDYQESSERLEAQLKQAQEKSYQTLTEADTKAQQILISARDEASRIRLNASEEARNLHQEALRKSAESSRELHERTQRETSEKTAQMIAQANAEIAKSREIFEKEQASLHADLIAQVKGEEKKLAAEKAKVETETLKVKAVQDEVAKAQAEKAKLEKQQEEIREALTKAQKTIASADEAEQRRAVAERELKKFVQDREEGLNKIKAELEAAKQNNVVEIEARKKEQENDLNKSRLKAMEDIKKRVEQEEQRYEQTRRLRAVEASERLAEVILPKLGKLPSDADQAKAQMKQAIDDAVTEVLMKGASSVQVVAENTKPRETETLEEKDMRVWKSVAAFFIFAIVGLYFYGKPLYAYIKGLGGDSYAEQMIERRRAESIYNPEQTSEFRETYADNVLYLRGYIQTKTDPLYIEQWTLRLNDIGFLKALKPALSEEEVVQFVAKETNMVQRLNALRGTIDAVYLKEGLDRLKTAEAEDMAGILAALKGQANFQKIRELERQFLQDYQAKNPPDRMVTGEH